tara:strand:- start:548 stop:1744 length:1197 start_codon:yes stop_codon:yes gene_type:complete
MPDLTCKECGKIYKREFYYKKHLKEKHGIDVDKVIKTDDVKKDIKAISLFSGMGGDSCGIIESGCELVAYSELEKVFRETHDLNFKKCKLLGNGDILKTDDKEFTKYKDVVNLIFAGFPCQGFSNAGKKLPDDPRNTLFREFLRATKLIEPDYIIGENVKGLSKRITSNGEKFIDVIKEEFENIGYDIVCDVLKCQEYGIPQSRERLIIVGTKKSLNKKYEFPKKINSKPDLKDIIKFSMEGALKIDIEDFDMSTIPNECIIKDLDNDETEDLEDKNKKPHPNLISLAKKRDYIYKGTEYPNRLSFGKRIPVGGEIIDIRNPSKTIICTYARQPRLFVPLQNKNGYYLRCLLPDELKQIQGFPEDYKMSGDKNKKIIQIGNAVPPPLIKLIIESLVSI